MKISIPNLPLPSTSSPAFVNPLANLTFPQAVAKVQEFLEKGKGKTLILTGAGVSVDSGIRAYRGDKGRYTTNPNFRPIFYGELVEPGPRGHKFRQRYWSRSYLGYPPVRDSQPNPTHMYIACLQLLGLAPQVITQNVDRLHHKASAFSSRETDARILELHGTLHFIHCIPHGHVQTRDAYQSQLGHSNPKWEDVVMDASGGEVKTNPDGDVELGGANYDEFVVPECRECERIAAEGQSEEHKDQASIVKPNVVFFGETISDRVKERSMSMVSASSQLLVLGTSLATYSAFRLIKQALEASKPVLMVSTGPSRADGMQGVEKIEMEAGPLLRDVVDRLTRRKRGSVGQEVQRMMNTGVTKAAADLKTSPTISHDEGSTLEAPRNAIFGGDFSLSSPMKRFARSRREYSTRAESSRTPSSVVQSAADAFSWRPSKPMTSMSGEDGPLAGKPLAIKDNFMLKGSPTAASSRMLRDLESPYTATSVNVLLRAGANIIGKTQMDEFGMGSQTTNIPEDLKPVHNPFRPSGSQGDDAPRSAGGSSGGSAAAVASGDAWAALGSDTGGSVRLPASYCGIVGLKPSYGVVSRHGVVSYADSLDCVGILAKNVKAIHQVFNVIAQPDSQDATCVSSTVRRNIRDEVRRSREYMGIDMGGLRIGIPEEACFDESTNPIDLRPLLQQLQEAGATLVPVSLPSIKLSLPAYYVIACAEASSNLARYGGEFYGATALPADVPRDRLAVRTWGFGGEVTKRVLGGTHALTAGSFENSYLKAMHLRRKLKVEMGNIFRQRNVLLADSRVDEEGVDVLLHLTSLQTAPTLDTVGEQSSSYAQDLLTVPASLAGLPCISLPGGFGRDGMPVGVSLTAQWGMDEVLLEVADMAESIWSVPKETEGI